MTQTISLKQTEQKAFNTVFEHGLWDIFIGCLIVQFAVAPLLSKRIGDFWSSAVFIPFWALAFVVVLLVRKHIIRPRIGVVTFRPHRKKKLTRLLSIMLVVNLLAMLLGLFLAWKAPVSSGWLHTLLLGMIVLVLSSIAAYYLRIPRFFIYGVLFLLSLTIGEWLYTQYRIANHGFPITCGITAGIVILTGLVYLLRFLRKYPLQDAPSEFREAV